mmetsp:Transcript_43103/g.131282  ORF Transcript_43103/g.131282 Transcript_43103/m.131282 type:complete len:202 (-) Transcript_43103:686-1291(-)
MAAHRSGIDLEHEGRRSVSRASAAPKRKVRLDVSPPPSGPDRIPAPRLPRLLSVVILSAVREAEFGELPEGVPLVVAHVSPRTSSSFSLAEASSPLAAATGASFLFIASRRAALVPSRSVQNSRSWANQRATNSFRALIERKSPLTEPPVESSSAAAPPSPSSSHGRRASFTVRGFVSEHESTSLSSNTSNSYFHCRGTKS